MNLASDAFDTNQAIPTRFTCDGVDSSPALTWSGAPSNTAAFALIVDDPDAPSGTFTHWVAFDIPAGVNELSAGMPQTDTLARGGLQGRNDFGKTGYGGPCPPSGTAHHYRFTLYALDEALHLQAGASKQDVLSAMRNHILEHAQLVGTYKRKG
jgi:Raf kinase inhibitor-like YbhB/YbcL family protein